MLNLWTSQAFSSVVCRKVDTHIAHLSERHKVEYLKHLTILLDSDASVTISTGSKTFFLI